MFSFFCLLLLSSNPKKTKKTKKNKKNKNDPHKFNQKYYALPTFNEFGGVLCALRAMPISVEGVGIH